MKSDIQREIELDELRKFKSEMETAAQGVQKSLHETQASLEEPVQQLRAELDEAAREVNGQPGASAPPPTRPRRCPRRRPPQVRLPQVRLPQDRLPQDRLPQGRLPLSPPPNPARTIAPPAQNPNRPDLGLEPVQATMASPARCCSWPDGVLLFVVFRTVFHFIATFAPQSITPAPDIEAYLSFVMTMFLAFGITFEVPVAVVLLVKMGVVELSKLAARGYVVVGAIIAAVVTPDVVSQFMLAVPLCLLYEVGLICAAWSRPGAPQRTIRHRIPSPNATEVRPAMGT